MKIRTNFWSVAVLAVMATGLVAATLKPMGAEHVRELKKRADGRFDVLCLDGETEIRTQQEVSAGAMCAHIIQKNAQWNLREGGVSDGVRFCDLSLKRLISRNRILTFEAQFMPPCPPSGNVTEECNGMSCSLRMGSTFYSFDFSPQDLLTVTRLSDGFSGVFSSGTSVTPTNPGGARLEVVGGVADVLQVSQDGEEWLSVCDDDFDQRDADVACRQMGFSSVVSFRTSITAGNDANYGMDDVNCDGTESSLFDCETTRWKDHNCGNGEHVTLVCSP